MALEGTRDVHTYETLRDFYQQKLDRWTWQADCSESFSDEECFDRGVVCYHGDNPFADPERTDVRIAEMVEGLRIGCDEAGSRTPCTDE